MHLPRPSEGGDFKPVPAGTYPAICFRVIDLGTQEESYQGETKRLHKVMLSFEIRDDDCKMEDGRPMSIHQRYTWSMHEKATLRKHLEAWRGKAFTDADFGPGGFDIRKLLGVPCMVAVTNKQSRDGAKTFSNLTAIAKLPKQMQASVGERENDLVYVALDDGFDPDQFAKLSNNLQEKIKASPEYQALMNGGPRPDESEDQNGRWAPVEDEIPF